MCKDCDKFEPTDRECDVCVLVNGDNSVKPTLYCRLCKAWICDTCRPNYSRRIIAALRKSLK